MTTVYVYYNMRLAIMLMVWIGLAGGEAMFVALLLHITWAGSAFYDTYISSAMCICVFLNGF